MAAADTDWGEKRDRYERALGRFIERLEGDRYVLAVVNHGTLRDDLMWSRETLRLWIIEEDGVTLRRAADGGDERIFRTLAEDDINIHAELIPRGRFKRMVEGASRTAFTYSFFSARRLVYCADASIAKWFEDADRLARTNQDHELLVAMTWVIHGRRHAGRLLAHKDDLELCAQTIVNTAHAVAALTIIEAGEICESECLDRAIEIAPELFEVIYRDVLERGTAQEPLETALARLDAYLDEKAERNLKPLLALLSREPREIALSELSDRFAHTSLHPWHLEAACEWLVRRTRLEKLSLPLTLTKKSRSQVEEPAYFLDPDRADPLMRTTIHIRGARENNLKDVDVHIPRDRLVVVTGVSGSGKSSLAFETLYAEGQRRLMASMSSWARRFVDQLKKPRVDFVTGLSPVVSIDQKTIHSNPRSTVGTMTDISDYLRMLFATVGVPHCPFCAKPVRALSARQVAEHVLSLPAGAEVEVRAPAAQIYGEEWSFVFEQIRKHGYRNIRVGGELHDLGDDLDPATLGLGEETAYVYVVVDTFVIEPGIEKAIVTSLEQARELGDGFFGLEVLRGATVRQKTAFRRDFGCKADGLLSLELHHGQFTFNDPAGACATCSGLGTYMRVHAPLLVPDPSRTLAGGAIVKEAFNHDRNTWGGRMLNSLALHYGFSLDVPFRDLDPGTVELIWYGTHGEKLPIRVPEDARQGQQHEGKEVTFQGVITQLERHYYWYRKRGEANAWTENYLKKVMVEHPCPDCGGARLKAARRLVTVAGRNLHEVGELHLEDLLQWIESLAFDDRGRAVGETLQREVVGRLELLIDIGVNYLSLNRRSSSLSGGEAQRIRLSTQIGSGLMGMLYVLDEPSIGLHPKDNTKMVRTMRRLVDIGNTVIVVEHDEETMRAADHLIEMGPGAGVHGGRVIAHGTAEDLMASEVSVTGAYLSGRRAIDVPAGRRTPRPQRVVIRGARHNNLRSIDVEIPLGVLCCVTGASGSGKSSLVHEILYKKLYALKIDSRTLAGDHDTLEGAEHVDQLILVDQSPIGRSSRSNPATYIGFYDHIRKLFAGTDESRARGYTPARFSFNVKGGRCEECAGEGTITTRLSFMPDIEVECPTCKGARYNAETLEVAWRGRSIAEVLDLSIEDAVGFFDDAGLIHKKLSVLMELGLGYLQVGHPAPILSGGEAQRVKLASELAKVKRGRSNLYILDEPTTGLHFADIGRLLESLNRLVDAGHTVLVIEHNLDVIKCADWVIDLGPEGGHGGGELLAAGPPEVIAACKKSHTGRFLAGRLNERVSAAR